MKRVPGTSVGFNLDHVVPDDGRRHVNPESPRNHKNEELRRRGLLDNEGKEWDDEQLDRLLETFLAGNYEFTGDGMRCIEACRRSRDAVGTALRKLAIRYDPPFGTYTPVRRTDRTGTPFNRSDYALLTLATDAVGSVNHACQPLWLERLLGRSSVEVERELHRIGRLPPKVPDGLVKPILIAQVRGLLDKEVPDFS